MTFNWFDLVVAAGCTAWIVMRYTRLRYLRVHWLASALLVIAFVFPLPVMSIDIEYDQLPRSAKEGLHDNFEFLFLLLKFPTYWFVLVIVWALMSYIKQAMPENTASNELIE